MLAFQGVNATAITPRGKQGDVDFGAAFELTDLCCRAGVHGIVLFGEEGEPLSFPVEERSRLVYLAVKRSRVPLLAGVGGLTLDMSVSLAREACAAGASGVLVPPPAFFRYEPEEIAEFYRQLASQMEPGTAIFLYNTPATTSMIPSETAMELLETGLFAGFVDAGGDPRGLGRLAAAGKGGCYLLSGCDSLFAEARQAGYGAVSAVACAVPELAMALDRAVGARNEPEVSRLTHLLEEFIEWAERFPRPVALRTATSLRGIRTGPAAVPLARARQKLLDQFREWFKGWLPAVTRMAANA